MDCTPGLFSRWSKRRLSLKWRHLWKKIDPRTSIRRKIMWLVFVCSTFCLVSISISAYMMFEHYLKEFIANDMRTLCLGVVNQFEKDLATSTRDVILTSNIASIQNIGTNSFNANVTTYQLNALTNSNSMYKWFGVADMNGTVLAAASGLLQGANVASRPWFQAAQTKTFVGDVHAAVLLANLLAPSSSGEPLRFVDVATPVINSQNQTVAVLGAHIGFEWAAALATSMIDLYGGYGKASMEYFLLDSQNKMLIAPARFPGFSNSQLNPLTLPDCYFPPAAGQTTNCVSSSWADTSTSYVSAQCKASDGILPAPLQLGWTMILRVPYSVAFAPLPILVRNLSLIGTGGLLVMIIFLFPMFAKITQPLLTVVAAASRILNLGHRRRSSSASSTSSSMSFASSSASFPPLPPASLSSLAVLPVPASPSSSSLFEPSLNTSFVFPVPPLPVTPLPPLPLPASVLSSSSSSSRKVSTGPNNNKRRVSLAIRTSNDGSHHSDQADDNNSGVTRSSEADSEMGRNPILNRNRSRLMSILTFRRKRRPDSRPPLANGSSGSSAPNFYLSSASALHRDSFPHSSSDETGILFRSISALINTLDEEARAKLDNEILEEKVAMRTQELSEVNAGLEAEIMARFEAERKATAAAETKTRFLSAMSHEMRTPLNAIEGFSALLEDSNLNSDQLEGIKAIRQSSAHLLSLVDDILDMQRIESGRMSILNAPLDLRVETIEFALQMCATAANQKHLQMGYIWNCDSELLLFSDSLRIRQIVTNLVHNSIKFTENGFVKVVVDARRLSPAAPASPLIASSSNQDMMHSASREGSQLAIIVEQGSSSNSSSSSSSSSNMIIPPIQHEGSQHLVADLFSSSQLKKVMHSIEFEAAEDVHSDGEDQEDDRSQQQQEDEEDETLIPLDDMVRVEITVADSGSGIDPTFRQNMFSPFSQADTSKSRKGGSGLGLSISRQLAQLMGGDVVCKQSSPETGTTFVVTFIARRLKKDEVGEFAPANSSQLSASASTSSSLDAIAMLRSKSILIALDDSLFIARDFIVSTCQKAFKMQVTLLPLPVSYSTILAFCAETQYDYIVLEGSTEDCIDLHSMLMSSSSSLSSSASPAKLIRIQRDRKRKGKVPVHVEHPSTYLITASCGSSPPPLTPPSPSSADENFYFIESLTMPIFRKNLLSVLSKPSTLPVASASSSSLLFHASDLLPRPIITLDAPSGGSSAVLDVLDARAPSDNLISISREEVRLQQPGAEGDSVASSSSLVDPRASRRPLTTSNASVLIAEDTPLNYRVLCKLLEKIGILNPVWVTDGALALEACKKTVFDIVLMDVHMPNMDGLEATRRILTEIESPAHRPIIIGVSANVLQEDIEKGLAVGMHCYIPKPVKIELLSKTMIETIALL